MSHPVDLIARVKACPKCGQEHARKTGRRLASYCAACHAAHMRATRPKNSELTGEAYKKQLARTYTKVYVRRGKIKRLPCEQCGSPDSQIHHEDYDKPLEVRWLCRDCHMGHHRAMEQAA